MSRSPLPRSIRKHIRLEKARIRRTAPSTEAAAERIQAFLVRYSGAPKHGTVR